MNRPPTSPADDAPALDDDIVQALSSAQAPEPLDSAMARRVKQRVLQRIAELQDRHLTIQADEDAWQPFGDGVQIKVLNESAGIMSYLLKLAPGASLPAHRHPCDEECVVLEGVLHIGELAVGPGGFHLARQHSLHDRIHTVTGATIFLRGASPQVSHIL
jgi:anti-sigma factor ChrR (cupin superfamily)